MTGLEIPGSCDKGSEKSGDFLPPSLPEFTVRIGEWKCRNPGMTVKMARMETMKANLSWQDQYLESLFGERLAWVTSNCITGYLMHDRKKEMYNSKEVIGTVAKK